MCAAGLWTAPPDRFSHGRGRAEGSQQGQGGGGSEGPGVSFPSQLPAGPPPFRVWQSQFCLTQAPRSSAA